MNESIKMESHSMDMATWKWGRLSETKDKTK